MVGGKSVNPRVNAMIVPGSGLVKEQAESEGLDKIFEQAGFDWREPGCSMCLAMNPDKLAPGERCASTSNRNFEGRQGYKGRTHLVSPAMAAAAAIAGISFTSGNGIELARLPPAAHLGDDDRPARAIFRREPRSAFAHKAGTWIFVFIGNGIIGRIRSIGVAGRHSNSRARPGGLRWRLRARRHPGFALASPGSAWALPAATVPMSAAPSAEMMSVVARVMLAP